MPVYTLGMAAVEYGKGGLFVVITIIVADSTDLSRRVFYLWCCHWTSAVWPWLEPWLDRKMAEWGNSATENWRVCPHRSADLI